MSYLDGATRARLERLRETDTIGLYTSDEPTEGTDPEQTITVTIDPTLRVTDVQIHRMDPLRQPNTLTKAFGAAYAAAIAARLPDKPEAEQARTADRPRPVATAAPIRISVAPPPELFNGQRRRERTPHPQLTGYAAREAVGHSRNECITATLPAASTAGTLTVDQGWVQQAAGANVAKAIVEAFVHAYSRRDN